MFAEISVLQIRLREYKKLAIIFRHEVQQTSPTAGTTLWTHRSVLPIFAKLIVMQIRLREYSNLKESSA